MQRRLAWAGGVAATLLVVVGIGTQFAGLDAARASLIGVIVTGLGGVAVAVINAFRDRTVAQITQAPTLQGLSVSMVESMAKRLSDAEARLEQLQRDLDAERALRRKAEDDVDIAKDEIRVLKHALDNAGILLPPLTPPTP